jgi:hypothetical protein
MVIQIHDPVLGIQYTLDPQKEIAHRYTIPNWNDEPVPAPKASAETFVGNSTAHAPNQRREDLGPENMEGVVVRGERVTLTLPAGIDGSDRPIVQVSEAWTSLELNLVISQRTTDPRWGTQVRRILNLTRSEPPAALFTVPPGYAVIDEKGPFSIPY